MTNLPTVHILNVPIHAISTAEALVQVREFMDDAHVHQIATANPEFVMTAQKDESFLRVLEEADLVLADGVGLLLAGRWLKQPFPERVAGSDIVYLLAEMAAQENWRLFLLGAAPGVAEEAAILLEKRYPGLLISGTYAGSPEPAENDFIVQQVNESQTDMLFVAYGAPRQDKWIARNKHTLNTVKVAVGIGGSLDFITGRSVRAPRWIQRLGLEWLHRLFQEPWRWRRMLALPSFLVAVLRNRR